MIGSSDLTVGCGFVTSITVYKKKDQPKPVQTFTRTHIPSLVLLSGYLALSLRVEPLVFPRLWVVLHLRELFQQLLVKSTEENHHKDLNNPFIREPGAQKTDLVLSVYVQDHVL